MTTEYKINDIVFLYTINKFARVLGIATTGGGVKPYQYKALGVLTSGQHTRIDPEFSVLFTGTEEQLKQVEEAILDVDKRTEQLKRAKSELHRITTHLGI